MTTSGRVRSKPRARPPASAEVGFPIVGVGASAGGLEAFTELLRNIPTDTGMAFVLVQHLDPQHQSALTDLLGRAATLPVTEVTERLRVEPNQVYVIPPNTSLSIAKGILHLKPRKDTRAPHHSIDGFFESLAADQCERAIGVILSGTATDGTLGLEAIKGEGGITFAQDETAKYDSMPRSAIAAGCVDFVLSPARIAAELGRIAKHPYLANGDDPEAALPARSRRSAPTDDKDYEKVVGLLRHHSGVDFSLYKRNTIQRRIARRMLLGKHATIARYATTLRGNTKELDALYNDALISVTSFFRNPEAFELLKKEVFPPLLQQRSDEPVRVWVLGCSTGQEAYSIAMAFMEVAENAPKPRRLQVFATDLNGGLLERARQGLYARGVVQDVSPQRLRRFFVEEEGGYRVIKSLREMVVFAQQNLISDPPFSRIDLISCRNVLIYLDGAPQRKVFPVFHYALKPGGHLLLGAAESVGEFTELFQPVDRKLRLYVRRNVSTPRVSSSGGADAASASSRRGRNGRRPSTRSKTPAEDQSPEGFHTGLSAQREADRLILDRFAPPGVLLNANFEIVQFRGRTADYLTAPSGKASFDILTMARDGLVLPLRTALAKARKGNKPVRKEAVRVTRDGQAREITLAVVPLRHLKERGYLVLFEPVRTAAESGKRKSSGAGKSTGASRESERRVRELEEELSELREFMHVVRERQEASREELQASSEEVQSANEELQSVNEELETSKEELESTNEELTTLNEEMASRNTELNRLNSDLLNLQSSTRLAVILLGRDLTIRRFSSQAEKQFHLLAGDIGRPFSAIRHNLRLESAAETPHAPSVPRRRATDRLPEASRPARSKALSTGDTAVTLDAVMAEVIATVREQEREVRDEDGCWFALRIRPYFTLDNKVDGAVLVLVDIDEVERAGLAAEAAREYAESITSSSRDPLLVLDAGLRVEQANPAFYRSFRTSAAATEGRPIFEVADAVLNQPDLLNRLKDTLPQHGSFDDLEAHVILPEAGPRVLLLNGRAIAGHPDRTDKILLGILDVTDKRHAEEILHRAGERFRMLAETMPQKIFTASAAGEIDYFNPQWIEYAGVSLAQLRGWGWTQLVHPEDVEENIRAWLDAVDSGNPFQHEYRLRRVDGEFRWHLTRAVPLRRSDGTVELWVGSNTDIHAERTRVDEMRRLAYDLSEADRRKTEFLAMLAHELRNPLAPIRNALVFLQMTAGEGEAVTPQLQMMERQLGQLIRIVDDLLDVSRISRGTIELHRDRVELAAVANQAADSVRPMTDKRSQILSVTLPDRPIYLNADVTRLTQIVVNLLTNASKFTQEGGHVWLEVEREDGNAVIRVRDDGIGIQEDELSVVFDMFRQLDATLERSAGGLGIGLALVRNLVELHGGGIEARSAGQEQGSEFVVRLPMLEEEAPVAAERVDEPVITGRPRRILVVDDNRDAVHSLAKLLELAGHTVRTAYDGAEAVDAADSFQPEVAVLDIGLPLLNGFEVAKQIRKRPWGRGVFVVALTGWGQDKDRIKSSIAGFDAHLVKPANFPELSQLIEQAETP